MPSKSAPDDDSFLGFFKSAPKSVRALIYIVVVLAFFLFFTQTNLGQLIGNWQNATAKLDETRLTAEVAERKQVMETLLNTTRQQQLQIAELQTKVSALTAENERLEREKVTLLEAVSKLESRVSSLESLLARRSTK